MVANQTGSDASSDVTLIVRRTIAASAARLFEAWTQPAQLMRWWGPRGVSCTSAEVELKVGGRYRLANQFADGKVIWISGVFEVIEPPTLLIYTWCIEPASSNPERVTVAFQARGEGTEVIVTHQRIASAAARDMHQQGWLGCLDGLLAYLQQG